MTVQTPFDRLTVTPEQFASPGAGQLFQALGVIHVRGAMDPVVLGDVKAEILTILDWLEEEVGERVPFITVMRGPYDPAMKEAYEKLLLMLHRVLTPAFPYRESIAGLFDCTEVQMLIAYAREAQAVGASAHVPLHQDFPTFNRASGIEEELKPKRTLTCWIPLEEMDDETPTIEYVPARLNMELPTTSEGVLDQEAVGASLNKLPLWVPPVALGDMCIHDQYTLHRSHITEKRIKPRRSFELRFVMR